MTVIGKTTSPSTSWGSRERPSRYLKDVWGEVENVRGKFQAGNGWGKGLFGGCLGVPAEQRARKKGIGNVVFVQKCQQQAEQAAQRVDAVRLLCVWCVVCGVCVCVCAVKHTHTHTLTHVL